MNADRSGITSLVIWELWDKDGNLKASGRTTNIITDTGDQVYATNVCGGATVTPLAKATGMQLGTGSTAASKSGAGAVLGAYLSTSDHTFDVGTPTAVNTPGAGTTVTYRCVYVAGEATSAAPITEAVLVNSSLVANGAAGGTAGTAGQTIARVVFTGANPKLSTDVLTVRWLHVLLGA